MKYSYTFMSLALAVPALADEYYCAQKCTESYDACRGKPGANMSLCASEYASCLGFNPFTDSYAAPTACAQSSAPAPYSTPYSAPYSTPAVELTCPETCEEKFNTCRGQPGAYLDECVEDKNACHSACGYSPSSSSYAPPPPPPSPTPIVKPDCGKTCEEKFDACRNKPGANISTCSSEKALCHATCGHAPVPTPTPTPTTPVSTPTSYPTFVPKPDCGKKCEDKFNACRGKPGANISTCASEKAACLATCGQNQSTGETSVPVYVGAGDSIKPALAAWTLGLGALMMLF
ncbi:hypothetical protein CP533_4416 [Ophiocordyceps camponoti-saundersi (nom. inval.)]|nr:hypothetical protein CP533_4416 [Ophiocordyceps camponoti-saundersi (nom. inval.)]